MTDNWIYPNAQEIALLIIDKISLLNAVKNKIIELREPVEGEPLSIDEAVGQINALLPAEYQDVPANITEIYNMWRFIDNLKVIGWGISPLNYSTPTAFGNALDSAWSAETLRVYEVSNPVLNKLNWFYGLLEYYGVENTGNVTTDFNNLKSKLGGDARDSYSKFV